MMLTMEEEPCLSAMRILAARRDPPPPPHLHSLKLHGWLSASQPHPQPVTSWLLATRTDWLSCHVSSCVDIVMYSCFTERIRLWKKHSVMESCYKYLYECIYSGSARFALTCFHKSLQSLNLWNLGHQFSGKRIIGSWLILKFIRVQVTLNLCGIYIPGKAMLSKFA